MDDSFWPGFQLWDKQASEAWTALIRSPQFADWMNLQLDNALLLNRAFIHGMDQVLQAHDLPTHLEQDRLLFLVHRLEAQVEELEERVNALTGEPAGHEII